MTRRRRAPIKANNIPTAQVKQVQGPQIPFHQPLVGEVVLTADLAEKYLGRGLIGFGPYLEVLQNKNASELARQHGYALFRRMLTDSEVDASMNAVIRASTSSKLVAQSPLDPGDTDYDLSLELVDFVNYCIGSWPIDEWRREQLLYALGFGNAVSELDWDVYETGKYANHFYIKRARVQEPEDYGFLVDRWGEIYGVVPLGQAAGLIYPLGNLISLPENGIRDLRGVVPRYKLSVWTWEQKGTDPRGTSLLIPAFIAWWNKQRAMEEWSCWLGRYAQPSVWATPGPDAIQSCITNPDGSQIITQPTEALLQALVNLKSASVLALPYGSVVNMLQAQGTVEPFLKSIELWDKEIVRAILGQHLATAEGGGTSAKTAAEIHAIILRQFISITSMFMIRNIEQDIVKPLIMSNYGDVGRLMPIISLGETGGFPLTSTEVAVLFQAGYFSEDQLQDIDKMLGIPVRTTLNRVGAGNLPKAIPEVVPSEAKPSNIP